MVQLQRKPQSTLRVAPPVMAASFQFFKIKARDKTSILEFLPAADYSQKRHLVLGEVLHFSQRQPPGEGLSCAVLVSNSISSYENMCLSVEEQNMITEPSNHCGTLRQKCLLSLHLNSLTQTKLRIKFYPDSSCCP